jgi:hypothetical protein
MAMVRGYPCGRSSTHLHLLLPLTPQGGWVLLEVLLFFVVAMLVLASVELHWGSRPPFLLLGGRPHPLHSRWMRGDALAGKKKSVKGAALGGRRRVWGGLHQKEEEEWEGAVLGEDCVGCVWREKLS